MDDTLAAVKILLVFPSKLTQFMLHQALSEAGYQEIATAQSVASAKASVAKNKPDVVIASMYFSDGDAQQLLQTVKAELPTLPFLLVSAEQRWQQLDPVKQSGVMALLKKPVDVPELLKALKFVKRLQQEGWQDARLNELTVLLVDDSPLAREHLQHLLQELSVGSIIVCENAPQAYQKLLHTPVDLVISDYHMPKMNGEQLLKQIRDTQCLEQQAVVFISSERDPKVLARLQVLGAKACLDKPFDLGLLKEVLVTHGLFSAVSEKL